jgi:hypothetical protein
VETKLKLTKALVRNSDRVSFRMFKRWCRNVWQSWPTLQTKLVRTKTPSDMLSDLRIGAAENALGVLSSMLTSISTFWGKSEITAIINLFINSHYPERLGTSINTFIKSLSRRVPTKTLLPALSNAWTTLQVFGTEVGSYTGFARTLLIYPQGCCPPVQSVLRNPAPCLARCSSCRCT